MSVDVGLVGHWVLDGDCDDRSGNGNHGRGEGVLAFTEPLPLGGGPGAAAFDGRSTGITVPHNEKPGARCW